MKLYNTKTRRPPVILSPSHCVILSGAKNLAPLRINSAKNLAYRLRYPRSFAALRVTTLPSLQEDAP